MRDFDSIREQAMSSLENRIRHVYNQGYAKGYDDGLNTKRVCDWEHDKSVYEKGLNDAWECVRKITSNEGFTFPQLTKLFGTMSFTTIFDQYSVSEIMAIIKEYEENQ